MNKQFQKLVIKLLLVILRYITKGEFSGVYANLFDEANTFIEK